MEAEIRGRSAFDVLVDGTVVYSSDSLERAVALRTVIAALGWPECRRIFGRELKAPATPAVDLAQYRTSSGERAMVDELSSMIATSNTSPPVAP